MTWWLVAMAASFGAAARHALDVRLMARRTGGFPWGTMAVNISGSLALGLLVGWVLTQGLPPALRLVLGTGFLGAYTTFSTWMFETLRLLERGERSLALLNVVGSWLAGTAAAALGLWGGLSWA
jgi:CrcB protein